MIFLGTPFHYLNCPNVYPTEPMKPPMQLPPFQHAFMPTFTGNQFSFYQPNILLLILNIVMFFVCVSYLC